MEGSEIDDKMTTLRELAKPLMDWLMENYDLHCQIIIEPGFVKVVQEQMGVPFEIEDDCCDSDGILKSNSGECITNPY